MLAGARTPVPEQYRDVYDGYAAALERADFSDATRRAYASRVRGYLAWLGSSGISGPDPLADPHARTFAARDYRAWLKITRKCAASTANAHLAAIDHFYIHLGLGPAGTDRDDLPRRAPRALNERQQKRYLRAVERRPLVRDRAIGKLLYRTGLRVAELVALDVDDVPLSARKAKVIVRYGKGGKSREVPVTDADARQTLADWIRERSAWPGANTPALFLNRRGGRLSARSVDTLMDELATDADIVDDHGDPDASAHVIRHTFGTQLLRKEGVDIVTVAELMGHKRLDTTRGYTLPTEDDLEDAVSRLPTDR